MAVDSATGLRRRTALSGETIVGEGVEPGIIALWHGLLAAIPTGWILCDGLNGTPDLRDRFIKGAAPGAEPGDTGGSATHTHDNHPALAHAGAAVADHAAQAHSGCAVGDHAAQVHSGSTVGNHVFTQPAGHANHVFTQPGGHSNHVFTQPAAHTVVATKQGSSAGNVVTTATHTGGAVDAHSAHSGGAVDAHSVTQPSQHPILSHGVTQPSQHPILSHGVTQPSDHAAQSHSAASNEPEYYTLAFIMKT